MKRSRRKTSKQQEHESRTRPLTPSEVEWMATQPWPGPGPRPDFVSVTETSGGLMFNIDPTDPRSLDHPIHKEQWLELARAIGRWAAEDGWNQQQRLSHRYVLGRISDNDITRMKAATLSRPLTHSKARV